MKEVMAVINDGSNSNALTLAISYFNPSVIILVSGSEVGKLPTWFSESVIVLLN